MTLRSLQPWLLDQGLAQSNALRGPGKHFTCTFGLLNARGPGKHVICTSGLLDSTRGPGKHIVCTSGLLCSTMDRPSRMWLKD